jgi:sigma-B regulation protein RsbU (phosphoserine phosphatase)
MSEETQAGFSGDKSLLRQLQRTLADIEASGSRTETLLGALESIMREFGDDLGLLGGRIYRREAQEYVLEHHFGQAGRGAPGLRIPASYAAIRKLQAEGHVLMNRDSPEYDEGIEESLGVTHFAAIGIGRETTHIIAFSVRDGADEELVRYALNAVRHVLNLKTRQRRLEGLLGQAREIQSRLVPYEPPSFAGFDIQGRTVPSDGVGGDVYDYLPVSDRILGVVIADAAGYGLPAALQARDVIIGMRMGVEDGFKMVRTVEKLNRVIHHGSLNSRFISLFYTEIEASGNLIYVNGGHNAPILLAGERTFRLRRGGMVLGPSPGARYERGFHVMEPGDLLVLFTDGITEATDARGQEFGEERLLVLLRSLRDRPAAAVVERVFQEVGEFSREADHHDDRTLVVVRRQHQRGS